MAPTLLRRTMVGNTDPVMIEGTAERVQVDNALNICSAPSPHG